MVRNNIQRVLGDRRDTLFWHDTWVECIPLSHKLPRLFDLAVDKECKVEEMSRLRWAELGCGVGVRWHGRRKV